MFYFIFFANPASKVRFGFLLVNNDSAEKRK